MAKIVVSQGVLGLQCLCIDMKLKVKYQYIQSQQSEKQLAALIRFLLEQQSKPKEDNDRSTLLPR